MVEAGRRALARAGVEAASVDRLYGYVSISEYIAPNGLFRVHAGLASCRAMVVPVNNEFSNFVTGCILASEAIAAGHCEYALVACGSSWSRNMDYELPHATVVGDGAGAALLGPSERMRLLGSCRGDILRRLRRYGDEGARYGARRLPAAACECRVPAGAHLRDHATKARAYLEEGRSAPPRLVQPAQHIDSFDELGNMGLASIPVTLARRGHEVTAAYLTLASLGPGTHAPALLAQR